MRVMTTKPDGTQRLMHERIARVLQQKGRLTYETRDMTAQPVAASAPAPASSKYDGMSKEELHELAKERGVKVHHAAGIAKVIEALTEADAQ